MSKTVYRVKNWSNYNRSLINRGNLTLWFSDDAIAQWSPADKKPGRGRPQEFSDVAIECCLALRSLFHLTLRATQGFVESLIFMLKLDIKAPDYSLLSKRSASLNVDLGALPSREPIHVVVDSTGLKVFGEGEWKMRCHGKSKRRKWRKLHLAINPDTNEIVGFSLSESNVHDSEKIEEILPAEKLGNVCADGAYDNQKSYDAIVNRGGFPLIPPRSGAAKTINPSIGMAHRNHTVQACWKFGRDIWKSKSGYHQRSLAETGMFRFKRILGASLASRNVENQQTEAAIKVKVLNRITHLGMPQSYKKS